MKIYYKLLITFSVIAILAGVVALYSLNATKQIIKSFEGGEEHFRAIIHAATEFSSHTKRSESHLILYLLLQEEHDRLDYLQQKRQLTEQFELLNRTVKATEGRVILKKIQLEMDKFQESGERLLRAYDHDIMNGKEYDIEDYDKLVRNFYDNSANLMGYAVELSNLETDFLNKQFAIMNASTINNLAKLAEGHLMLYMTLHDQRDLERFLVGVSSLEKTVAKIVERVRDNEAQLILDQLEAEVKRFASSGAALFGAFHATQERLGQLELKNYNSQIREFHEYSSRIRELGVELANLMTDQEHRKKESALRTAASIQRSVFILVVVGGLMTLLLGYILSKSVAEPIIKLKEAASNIGKGNLDTVIDISSKNEIGSLAETFKTMADDLKIARDELLAAKDYTDNILRSMSDALFVVSPEGEVQTINEAACKLLGYTPDEIIGSSYEMIFSKESPIIIDKGDPDAAKLSSPIVIPYKASNGRSIYVSFSSSVMYDSHGEVQGIVCVAQDMTERRKAMQEIRQLATVIRQVADGIVVSDVNGVIQYVNPAFERLTGYSRYEVEGMPINILKSGKHEEAFYQNLWNTLQMGENWSGVFINKKKDGTLYEEECTISPVYGESREIINYVALKRDVTKEKRLERQLQQSQKHQALGTLAGGIAHDFNNILSAIIAYVEGVLTEVQPDSDIHRNLTEVVKAGKRAADLVNQILTFSRPTRQEKKTTLLQPVIKGALKLIRGTMPTTIEIKTDIDAGCRPVLADGTQINQVIVNLCTNSYHAMRENGGLLAISLKEVEVGKNLAAERPNLHPGPYALLTVRDSGTGMTSDILQRIFEPYYTTKRHGEGTGLGLATVHGIVESHHGEIIVKSEPGKGSVFDVYLPIMVHQVSMEEREKDQETPAATGRILFVDDEAIITQSMSIVLKKIGCEVSVFNNSMKALEDFKSDPQKYDLVITDQTMPKLVGSELAQEILKIRPDMPIILTTGYTDNFDEQKAKEIGIRAFLMKPMIIEELKQVVWKLLRK